MNLWEITSRISDVLDFDKRIYCGFSANIDVVAGVEQDAFLEFQKQVGIFPPRRSQAMQPPLCSRNEIIDYACWYMARGMGCDSDVRNIESMSALMEKPGTLHAVGGTGAQAANWLALAGFRNIHLSVPYNGAELTAALHPQIAIHDNHEAYKKETAGLDGVPDIHCIIDYAAGTRVGFAHASIAEAPAPNRVMLSQDRCCSRLTIAPEFKTMPCGEKTLRLS